MGWDSKRRGFSDPLMRIVHGAVCVSRLSRRVMQRQVARVAQRASLVKSLSKQRPTSHVDWRQGCALITSGDQKFGHSSPKGFGSTWVGSVGNQAWHDAVMSRGMATATTPTQGADASSPEHASEKVERSSRPSGSLSSPDTLDQLGMSFSSCHVRFETHSTSKA
eukprot:1177556-Prorocentrum_minimum.AAC.2